MTKYPLVIGMFLLVAAVAWMWNYAPAVQPVAAPRVDASVAAQESLESAPYLRAADSANAAQKSKLWATARWAVNSATDDGIVRDETGPNFVIVGPKFYIMDFSLKSTLCAGLAIVREQRGLSRDFALIESINNRPVGTYVRGQLEMR